MNNINPFEAHISNIILKADIAYWSKKSLLISCATITNNIRKFNIDVICICKKISFIKVFVLKTLLKG